MNTERGFTLVELMIVIAIVAILASIGIHAYQGYLQKAAMTDMLQSLASYQTAVNLCALENSSVAHCNAGSQGIPAARGSRYVSNLSVTQGVISLTGQSALQGLHVTLIPYWDSGSSSIIWRRHCQATSQAESLIVACERVFRFDDVSK
ncbi:MULTISPECIES: prepilin peptidase-dependent pilin [Symbiopectobacterium]|uniref:prepilin peptidase-dependent pilin n=1 Tax=Symbiopectobacterium TaxID=801 RepID=UPI001A32A847|nr:MULTISPECIES: prepilin peptidase-dependent pilin [Symbiopectobacterium]MBG6248951.1 prepilin peptidase-dependent pilin [Candidatus Symbiopectobacterium sp. PLON1]